MLRFCFALICALLPPTAALAQSGIAYAFMPLGGNPDVQTLAPGQVGSYAFRVTNRGAVDGTARVRASLDARIEAAAQYSFVSSTPACGTPVAELDSYGSPRLYFPVTLAAGASAECRYSLTRSASSTDDLGFAFPGACNYRRCEVRRGTFTDQSLHVAPAPQPDDGPDRRTLRLAMGNAGEVAVVARSVITECAEFGEGEFGRVPFVIDNDFPGACPTSDEPSPCINFTGQSFDSYGFTLGPAPPGGEASCLVRLRYPRGRVEPAAVELSFDDDRVTLAGNASSYDRVFHNDATVLGATFAQARQAIPVRGAALWLAIVFVLTAAWRLRR